MAARARKTNARGEAMPDAEELGAVVEEEDPVAELVFEPVELAPDELVLEPELEEVLELEPLLTVELPDGELVTDAAEDEPVEEAAEESVLLAAAEEAVLLAGTPPINWNWGL
jgi:hypothetical protein